MANQEPTPLRPGTIVFDKFTKSYWLVWDGATEGHICLGDWEAVTKIIRGALNV